MVIPLRDCIQAREPPARRSDVSGTNEGRDWTEMVPEVTRMVGDGEEMVWWGGRKLRVGTNQGGEGDGHFGKLLKLIKLPGTNHERRTVKACLVQFHPK